MSVKTKHSVFSKLFRYYCRKLWEQGLMVLFMLLYSLFIMRGAVGLVENINQSKNGQEYLINFGIISILQAVTLAMIISQLVTKLVGLIISYSGSFSFRRGGTYKKSSADDIMVLIITPRVSRKTMIFAKYAAVFTYFFWINLLFLTLPLAFYFLLSLSLLSVISFVLLNGLILVFVNFLFIVPYLFYLYEDYSFLSSLIFLFIAFFVGFFVYFLRETVSRYPLLFPLFSIPLSGLVGYLFFSLYRQKFLKRDIV